MVGEPVRFRFLGSNVRMDDPVGTRLDYWAEGELEELDEIEMDLPAETHQAGEVVPVHLAAHVTEVGTLQMEAVATASGERWNVEFDVRAGETTDKNPSEFARTTTYHTPPSRTPVNCHS